MHISRYEMADIAAEIRIRRALKAKLLPASKCTIYPGHDAYVHHERDNEWKEPYKVTRTFEKMVWVQRLDKEAMYSIDHTLPVQHAPEAILINYLSSSFQPWKTQPDSCRIYHTDVLQPGDLRHSYPKFIPAIKKELQGLFENGVFETIAKEEVPPDSNILESRCVLTIKNKDYPEELYKATIVVQGHKDRDKYRLVHPSTTLK